MDCDDVVRLSLHESVEGKRRRAEVRFKQIESQKHKRLDTPLKQKEDGQPEKRMQNLLLACAVRFVCLPGAIGANLLKRWLTRKSGFWLEADGRHRPWVNLHAKVCQTPDLNLDQPEERLAHCRQVDPVWNILIQRLTGSFIARGKV